MSVTVARQRQSTHAFWRRAAAGPSPGKSILAVLLCTAGMLIFPYAVSEYQVLVAISFLTFAIVTVSQVLVWGFGGILSFAQAAFFALGAYGYAVIAGNLDETTGPVIALVAAPLVVMVFAGFLGFFIFYGRMGAFLLGIVTLSVSLMLGAFLNQTGDASYRIGKVQLSGYNGINAIPPLLVAGTPASTQVLYFLTAAVLLAGVAGVALFRFHRVGVGIRAIAENPIRAELFGYNVRAYRLSIFMAGAALAAAGGEFYAIWGSYTSPSLVTMQAVTLPVVVAAVAGRDRPIAAMLAALVYSAISVNLASSGASYALIILGVGLVVVMLVAPGGVGGWVAALVNRLVIRIGTRSAESPPAESPHTAASQDDVVELGSTPGSGA
jgi:ABC-type branched-subunit amino acid transport system permease subunit